MDDLQLCFLAEASRRTLFFDFDKRSHTDEFIKNVVRYNSLLSEIRKEVERNGD